MAHNMAMKMANIADFKNHLSEYLNEVQAGEGSPRYLHADLVDRRPWKPHTSRTEVYVSPISCALATIEEAYSLPEPFHRDPADRIIVASARRLACSVVTADAKIINCPHVETVW